MMGCFSYKLSRVILMPYLPWELLAYLLSLFSLGHFLMKQGKNKRDPGMCALGLQELGMVSDQG